jgi:uncharacterized protein (UPF0333 family)
MRRKNGQSILEYVIVLTAIVVCIIWAASKYIKPAVTQGITDAQQAIGNAADRLPATSSGGG